jgi:hypothetical protein
MESVLLGASFEAMVGTMTLRVPEKAAALIV